MTLKIGRPLRLGAGRNSNRSGLRILSNGSSAPTVAATLTVPAAKVASTLTNFPVRVNLADMPAPWWASVAANGSNIRVKAAGVAVPTDVIRIDKAKKIGEVYFKAPSLTTSANAFTVEAVSGAPALAVTDPLGRNAVWADYEWMQVGEDAIDRTGSGSGTINGAPPPYYTMTKVSPPGVDLDIHQGIVSNVDDGTWFGLHTTAVVKYDANWNEVTRVSNFKPIPGRPDVDQVELGVMINGELFVAMNTFPRAPTTTMGSPFIIVMDPTTLAVKRTYDVSAQGIDASGLAYCPTDGLLYVSSYSTIGTRFDRYNPATMAFVSSLTLSLAINGGEGMTWHNGYFWRTTTASQFRTLYRIAFDGTVARVAAQQLGGTSSMQGLTTDANDKMYVLFDQVDSSTTGSYAYRYDDKREAFNPGGAGYLVPPPVAKFTTFTLGTSAIPWKAGTNELLSYGASNSDVDGNRVTIAVNNATSKWGTWNSTNTWLDSTKSSVIGERTFVRMVQKTTTAREIWVDGTMHATGATAQRPALNGDKIWLGRGDGDSTVNFFGAAFYAYLRNGALGTDWIAAEYASWDGSAFYTIT